MRVSTIVMLLGAAACAAAAALLTKTWFSGSPELPPARVAQQAPVNRTIVVAAAPLKFGAVLSAEALSEVPWPAALFPADAFASRDALFASGQRIALSAIAKNEPILASKITGPGQRAPLSVLISAGRKAVTIRVDDVLGVAGFVQPDDRVDVLLTRNERAGASASPTLGSTYTDVLLQNVRVLGIDQIAERNPQAKPVKTVTLELETDEAQKLVLAASVGQLSLALRRAGWTETSEFRRIGLEDLPSTRLPEAVAPVPAPEAPEQGPLVTIIRGAVERKQYNVSDEQRRAPVGASLSNRQTLTSVEDRTGADPGEERPR